MDIEALEKLPFGRLVLEESDITLRRLMNKTINVIISVVESVFLTDVRSSFVEWVHHIAAIQAGTIRILKGSFVLYVGEPPEKIVTCGSHPLESLFHTVLRRGIVAVSYNKTIIPAAFETIALCSLLLYVLDVRLLKQMCGGFDRVGATVDDCNDDKLVGLFWADEQAIKDYAIFDDIVSFDATFRSNKESWIPAFFGDELMTGLMRTTSRYIERKNDHDSRYKNPKLKTDLQMEKEASTFDTQTVFFDVQDEIYASYSHCMLVNVVQVDFCKSKMEVECSYSILESEVFNLYEIFESTIDRLVHDMDKLKIYKEQMKDLLNKAKIDVPMVPKLNSKDVFSAMLGVKKSVNTNNA
nr:hypothetical protein [Tanacetum cinerariifolium]